MYVCFELSSSANVDDLWDALSIAGVSLTLSTEDPQGDKQIFGYISSENAIPLILKQFPSINSITVAKEEPVDWESQWQDHGNDFRDGLVHLDLSEYRPGVNRTLQLEPGAGFGDLSHPTTRLTLKLMAPYVKDAFVIDVGCGSGVLAVAAAALGAKTVHGIDIDSEAIEHTQRNAELNAVEQKITLGLPEVPFSIPNKTPIVIAMNMIQAEQMVAWKALNNLHKLKATIITSGILTESEKQYLEWGHSQGWKLIKRQEEQGWLGFLWNISL